MSLSFQERKAYILELLEKEETIKVAPLAKELSISEITIRRDLERLEKEGFLTKTFGGAKKRDLSLNEFLQTKKIRKLEKEKKRIGTRAAKLIKPGDVIFIDNGTTSYYVCKALKNISNVTIITNSLLVLSELRFSKDIELILLGGHYDLANFSLNGPLTENNIKNFRTKYAFVGADGISISHGVTANNIYAAEIVKLMMRFSEQSILVSDHTKIGQAGPFKYAEIDDFDLFITDDKITPQDYNNFVNNGLRVEKV